LGVRIVREAERGLSGKERERERDFNYYQDQRVTAYPCISVKPAKSKCSLGKIRFTLTKNSCFPKLGSKVSRIVLLDFALSVCLFG
jgi:hypothetical protein